MRGGHEVAFLRALRHVDVAARAPGRRLRTDHRQQSRRAGVGRVRAEAHPQPPVRGAVPPVVELDVLLQPAVTLRRDLAPLAGADAGQVGVEDLHGQLRPHAQLGGCPGGGRHVVEDLVDDGAAGEHHLGDAQPAQQVGGLGVQVALHRQRQPVEAVRAVFGQAAEQAARHVRVHVDQTGQQRVPGELQHRGPGRVPTGSPARRPGRHHDPVLDHDLAVSDDAEAGIDRDDPPGPDDQPFRLAHATGPAAPAAGTASGADAISRAIARLHSR